MEGRHWKEGERSGRGKQGITWDKRARGRVREGTEGQGMKGKGR